MGLLREETGIVHLTCNVQLSSHGEEEHEVLEGLQNPIQFLSIDSNSSLNHLTKEELSGAEGEDAARIQTPPSWTCSTKPSRGRDGSGSAAHDSTVPLGTHWASVQGEAWGWESDTSILGNLPKPSPQPLTDLTAVPSIRPSHALSPPSQNPLTRALALPADLAVGPASLPPPHYSQDPHTVPFSPSGSCKEVQGRKREKALLLPSGPFCSPVNGDLHSPLLLARARNRKVKQKLCQRAGGGRRVKKEGRVEWVSPLSTGPSAGTRVLGQEADTWREGPNLALHRACLSASPSTSPSTSLSSSPSQELPIPWVSKGPPEVTFLSSFLVQALILSFMGSCDNHLTHPLPPLPPTSPPLQTTRLLDPRGSFSMLLAMHIGKGRLLGMAFKGLHRLLSIAHYSSIHTLCSTRLK